jgi:Carboxylesterase family
MPLSFPLDKSNVTNRVQLYIDLVSDLMFNFHMVQCLNLRSEVATENSSNYAYVYSHRPTFKVRSTLRDQFKLLPGVIGHFAELGRFECFCPYSLIAFISLDYVFGVPLVGNYSRFHRNVNMSYNNYSTDEEDFSRQLIRYWSNFIKTGSVVRAVCFETTDTYVSYRYS